MANIPINLIIMLKTNVQRAIGAAPAATENHLDSFLLRTHNIMPFPYPVNPHHKKYVIFFNIMAF
jgi:hypothetical protein